MNLMKSYLKTVIAKITGDKAQDIAERNYRKAMSAIKQQTASQENAIITLEEKLQNAKDALHDAKYPDTPIEDGQKYLATIALLHEEVLDIENEIKGVKSVVTMLEDLSAEFNNEAA